MIKKILNSLLILLAGAIIGYGLLIAAFSVSIPEGRYAETRTVIDAEGYHPRESLRDGKNDYFHEVVPDILDFGTDQLIVDYSLINPAIPIYKHALIEDYCRYWHGYVIFWRPLFKLFDLDEVRIINLGIQVLLAVVLAFQIYLVSKRKRYVLAWLTIYFFLGPNSMGCNFQYSSIYYVTVIATIVLLRFKQFFEVRGRYLYLFLIAGMCTSYFDFLTYPMLTWAIPAALMVAFYETDNVFLKIKNSAFSNCVRVAVSALFWIAGYLLFWAEKWLLGQMLTDKDVLHSEVIVETSLRVGITDSMSLGTRLESFWTNWQHLTYQPFALIVFVWVGYWIICVIRRGVSRDSRIAALAVMLLSAPVWYICGSEHTKGHHLYTWRVSLGTLFAALLIICISSEKVREEAVKIKGALIRSGIIVASLLFGLLMYIVVPVEKATYWNYDLPSNEQTIPAGEENAFIMKYTPLFSRVMGIGPLFECETDKGFYEIKILDADKVLYTEQVDAEFFNKERVNSIDVDWHLKKGKTYTLVLSSAHLDKPATIWVTEQNDRPEYIGNEESLQTGFTYHTAFADKSTSGFYIITWAVLLVCIMQAIYCLIGCRSKKEEVRN